MEKLPELNPEFGNDWMSDILKILLVEDNPGDIVLLRETLREMTASAYELKNVSSLSESLKEIVESDYDVVLLDLNLPDGKGLDNIKRISAAASNIPIIVMTGLDDEMMAVEAVRTGAQDYLVKGEIAPDVFWRAMRYAVERKRNDERLQKAKELAEAATQAKSEFLAHMSHEIRTPLNVILGISDLLMGSPLNEEQKHYVEIFKNSSETLLYLINDLLDLSKIEAGKLEVNNVSFNFIKLINGIEKFMQSSAERKNNRLKLELVGDIPEQIVADPQRLRQVLYNLLGNSIKFTENGNICCRVCLNAPSEMEFSIEDTGIGISKDKIESIFESFTQEDSSTSQNFGGTGLGLSICSKLVDLWKGKIWAESEKGKGSRFKFTLPFELSEPSENGKVSASKKSELSVGKKDFEDKYSSEKPLRVLVVDDSVDNRFLLNAFLKSPSFHVYNAENGEKAIECWKEEPVDIILLDMQMPIMDGYECAGKLRELEKDLKKGAVPIIALTAFSQKEDRDKCIGAGCSDYLSKPVEKPKLFAMMGKWLNVKAGKKPVQKMEIQSGNKIVLSIDENLKELIPDYLDRKSLEVDSIFELLSKMDGEGIARIGHNMLGTGSPYGFNEISRLGKIIELSAKEQKWDVIHTMATELKQYLQNIELTYK